MSRLLRWLIVLALAGTLCVVGLAAAVALGTADRSLPLGSTVYVEGVVGFPTYLNPLVQAPDAPQSERDLARLLFSGLTTRDGSGQVVPALAERWTISADQTVYTFTLRSGLRWHDGVPVTAADVVWTIESVQNPEFPGDPALPRLWQNVTVEQVGDRQVLLTLRTPYAPLLAATDLPILPAHLLQETPLNGWRNALFSRAPIGTGPFRLEQLTATEAVLRPFEGATQGRPVLHTLVLRFYATTGDAAEALRRGEIQGLASTTPLTGVGLERASLRTTTALLDEYTSLSFNLRTAPLDDSEVRRALVQSLDRMSLLSPTLTSAGAFLETPFLNGSWALDDSAKLPPTDPTEAARSLARLGWEDNGTGVLRREDAALSLPILVSNNPAEQALAEAVAQQWRAQGIQATVAAVPPSELDERIQRRDFTVVLHSWQAVGVDPDIYALWHSSQAEGGANYAGLQDAELDRLLVAGRTTADQGERTRLYSAAQRRWLELLPGVPLFQSELTLTHDINLTPTGLEQSLLHGSADRWRTVSGWTVQDN